MRGWRSARLAPDVIENRDQSSTSSPFTWCNLLVIKKHKGMGPQVWADFSRCTVAAESFENFWVCVEDVNSAVGEKDEEATSGTDKND